MSLPKRGVERPDKKFSKFREPFAIPCVLLDTCYGNLFFNNLVWRFTGEKLITSTASTTWARNRPHSESIQTVKRLAEN